MVLIMKGHKHAPKHDGGCNKNPKTCGFAFITII